MTEITIAQDAPVLVAIDIAKARHEVLIAVPDKKRRRRLAVLNQLTDFNRLIAALKEYGRPVRAAFEATGNYHRALAYHLVTAGFEVKPVSSVALARTREALNNSWDKNDPKDAQVILHMMEIGTEQFYHDPLVLGTNDIQELSKTHDIVSKSKTELWHRVLTEPPLVCRRPRSKDTGLWKSTNVETDIHQKCANVLCEWFSSIRANLTASLLRSNRLRRRLVAGLIHFGRGFDALKRTAVDVMA